MTRGLVRYQRKKDLHFITFSCYQRRPYLNTPEARSLSLETMRLRYRFFVAGYVVMPEHVHLLVTEPEGGALAIALQALKLSVAVKSEQRPFWEKRYYDFNIYNDKKRVEKLRYIHRNPVRRGLVEEPEAWAWSSFRHCWTGEEGAVEIESNWTVRKREQLGIECWAPRSSCEPMSQRRDMGHPISR